MAAKGGTQRVKSLKGEARHQIFDNGTAVCETRLPGRPEWMMSGRFVLHEDRLLLVEVRIFPAEDRNPPGLLDGAKTPQEAALRVAKHRGGEHSAALRPVPHIGEWSQDPTRIAELGIEEGLPATAFRELRTGPLFEEIQAWSALRAESQEAKEVYARMAATPNPGRQRRDDLHFAEWSRRIAEKTRTNPQSPIQAVADETGFDRNQVRDIAHECRSRGFLGRVPGRGGGYLTDKARGVLNVARRKGRKR